LSLYNHALRTWKKKDTQSEKEARMFFSFQNDNINHVNVSTILELQQKGSLVVH